MGFRSHWSCVLATAISLSFASTLSTLAFAQDTNNSGQIPNSTAVSVQLFTDKASYKPDDTIDVRILLTNRTGEPIYIRRPLRWGLSASVEIWAKDITSDASLRQRFSGSPDPPPRSKDDFIRLDPSHVYGVLFAVSLKELGIKESGKYELNAIYHSQTYGAEFRFGLPSWKGEEYALRTIPAVISVAF